MITLRPYQQEASDSAVAFLTAPTYHKAGLIVAGTGTGKSVIIADIASRLDGDVLVLQPSKEILEQNFAKYQNYGFMDCSIYSASCGQKRISKVTFATIGSIYKRVDEFRHFRYCIIDECDVVNPEEGMYKSFLTAIACRVVGLTATPYRLYQTMEGSVLRFLTRQRPAFFGRVLYHTQQEEMARLGYLSPMQYYYVPLIDESRLQRNSSGQDYTERSIRREFQLVNFDEHLTDIVLRLLHQAKTPRKGILIFTRFIEEAERLIARLGGLGAIVTGGTPKAEREEILRRFRAGELRVVANVDCLSVGFDYPELDTIVLARPTRSLRLYYQQVGRAIRPHRDKPEAWIIDLVGTSQLFGKVEHLQLRDTNGKGAWVVENQGRQLTNITIPN